MAVLTVDNLHLRYGDNPILKGVSMALQPGEVVSLLGPSGSGKTTLLRAVAGLEQPHEGTIRIGERVVFDGAQKVELPAEKRDLGLVFQSYALWPHRTVVDNVAYGLKLRKVSADEVKARVQSVLDQLGLGALGGRFPHELSGGQQQRVAIARAIITDPTLIVADEPTGDLDRTTGGEILALLERLNDDLGKTIIMVTHDPKAAERAHRLVHLEKGVLVD